MIQKSLSNQLCVSREPLICSETQFMADYGFGNEEEMGFARLFTYFARTADVKIASMTLHDVV